MLPWLYYMHSRILYKTVKTYIFLFTQMHKKQLIMGYFILGSLVKCVNKCM